MATIKISCDKEATQECLRQVLVAAFPEEKALHKREFYPKLEEVTFHYVDKGSILHVRFGGVTLSTANERYGTIQRRVLLDRDDRIDIDKVRAKFAELNVIGRECKEIKATRDAEAEVHRATMRRVREEIDLPDSILHSKQQDELEIKFLSEDQVRLIAEFVKKIR